MKFYLEVKSEMRFIFVLIVSYAYQAPQLTRMVLLNFVDDLNP